MLDYLSKVNKLEIISQRRLYDQIFPLTKKLNINFGREGYIVQTKSNPFANKWKNPLTVVFSYLDAYEAFEYSKLNKLFREAITNSMDLTVLEKL